MPELDNKQIEGLQRLLSLLNPSTLTTEQFVSSFENVVKLIKKVEKKNIEDIDKIKQTFDKLGKQMTTDHTTRLSEVQNLSKLQREQIEKMFNDKVKQLDDFAGTITSGIDGVNGKDADEETIVKAVLGRIPEPVKEILEGDDRPDVGTIKGLRSIIDELRNRTLGRRVGGGFSTIAMNGHIVDDETPSGTVNGTNKAFTILTAPNPANSLKVFVNGQRMKLTEDYTFSGVTITFSVAPPSTSVVLCDYRI